MKAQSRASSRNKSLLSAPKWHGFRAVTACAGQSRGFTKAHSISKQWPAHLASSPKRLITVSKKPIKIVKRDELSRAAELEAAPTIIPTEEDSARSMTKTVTGWIREFKERSDAEAGKMLAVFRDTGRPNEA